MGFVDASHARMAVTVNSSMTFKESDRTAQPTAPSKRLIDAIAHGEVTVGGLAEAGWFVVGTLVEDQAGRTIP